MIASMPKSAETGCSTPRQRQAAAMLATGKGIRETAAALKMGEPTCTLGGSPPTFALRSADPGRFVVRGRRQAL